MAFESQESLAALELIEARTREHLAEIERTLGRLAGNLANRAAPATTTEPQQRARNDAAAPRTSPVDDPRQQERDRVQPAMEEHLRQIRTLLENPPQKESTFS